MDYEISLDPLRIQADRVFGWLRSTYWATGMRREVFEQAIRNSLVIGAYDRASGEQVGFARIVTDYATFAWVSDVFVPEPARKHGIAKAMLQSVIADPRMQTLRRWSLATRDAQGVYAPLGFVNVKAENWMELVRPKSCWSEEP